MQLNAQSGRRENRDCARRNPAGLHYFTPAASIEILRKDLMCIFGAAVVTWEEPHPAGQAQLNYQIGNKCVPESPVWRTTAHILSVQARHADIVYSLASRTLSKCTRESLQGSALLRGAQAHQMAFEVLALVLAIALVSAVAAVPAVSVALYACRDDFGLC